MYYILLVAALLGLLFVAAGVLLRLLEWRGRRSNERRGSTRLLVLGGGLLSLPVTVSLATAALLR